ncbi:hypothetical protein QE422_001334 [Chryseobacterium sp. SORGH_AS 447]|uniref:hypothetical protein n=1 Tax=Chryseobacterium sp. SORGH_AS_0447 TaxID=3041769 RepID=UPI002781757E|nr:hypothetical protein [Chryseobacterium sp. SORGH_AS_0447]MDQ1160966.1 hypothetical protein [Chryseobacterium sp. SORGH_AS_0447]
METRTVLIMSFLLINFCHAQDHGQVKTSRTKVFGFSPSKNVKNVDGILVKYFDQEGEGFKPKKVNGLGMGLNIIGIFVPALLLFNVTEAEHWNLKSDETVEKNKMNKINGMQLSLINMEPTITNGLEINVSSNMGSSAVTNGVAVSPFFNIHHEMKGFSIAPLANVGKKCRGLQIGIFNKCEDFRGIQLGWWNENEKRKLPFVNWNFKAKIKKP